MEQCKQRLDDLDWNFADVPADRGIHAIHPYPAKFIGSIPRQLIELYYPGDSSVVLDPFCGSGTTLVEAVSCGIEAWGIDLHPLACLIARVKTRQLGLDFADATKAVIQRGRAGHIAADDVSIPNIPNVDHWFKPDIQRALAALLKEIDSISSLPSKEALQVALSSIVVRVSNQESDTRYAAIDKNVSEEDVFSLFEKAARNVANAVSSFRDGLFSHFGKATVLNKDTLDVPPNDLPRNVGLVITSPPYPNAYEYWLYHKYRMFWLGMNPIAVREREIGARPHYFKTNHLDERDFERQMGICFHLLSQVMLPGTKACFLVGRSIIHGREIDNASLLTRAAHPHGFDALEVVERDIPARRKSFNLSHAKIMKEHLIVFSLR